MLKDLQKYKRIFTFGCSFTANIYPTYADVIASECEQSTLYNLGRSGSGNSLITYKMVEANNRFKFTEDDLVVVMYTSFFREDRFVATKWECHGNVFNNDFYDESFIKKYVDPNGYMIKSCATIALGNSYAKSLPCDSLLLNAWPFFGSEMREIVDKKYIDDLKHIYKSLIDSFPVSLYEYLFPRLNSHQYHTKGHTYLLPDGTEFKDAHPNPLAYYDYLKNGVGLHLTDKALNYATNETEELKKCDTLDKITARYSDLKLQNDNRIKPMYF